MENQEQVAEQAQAGEAAQAEEAACRFTAETMPDEQLMKEGYQAVLWGSWRSVVALLIGAISLIIAGRYIVYSFTVSGLVPYVAVFLFLGGFTLYNLFSLPKRSAQRYFKVASQMENGVKKLRIVDYFGEDSVRMEKADGSKNSIRYDQVKYVYETKHGIMLRLQMLTFHAIAKEGLRGGSVEEFKAFLKEKMPWAKFSMK